ncbi:TPA: hypothetical protein ACJ2W2_000855 [Enterobacter cloacae]
MKLFEMEGFLRGKCLPGDMKVNETNAEYLVRKFTELEHKLAESQREFRAADATIENLQMKLEKMAAENAGLKRFCKDAAFDADYEAELGMERGGFTDALNDTNTPATDAFLAEVRASALPVEIAEIIDSGDLEAILFATEYPEAERYRMALYNFRTSRKGVQP